MLLQHFSYSSCCFSSFISCVASLFIVLFASAPMKSQPRFPVCLGWEVAAARGNSGSHSGAALEHNAFLPSYNPNSPSIRCDLYFAYSDWDRIGRTFPRLGCTDSSPIALSDQNGWVCALKHEKPQHLALITLYYNQIQSCSVRFRTLSARSPLMCGC